MVEETKDYRNRALNELEEFNNKIFEFITQNPGIFATATNSARA
jgi:hypothetical protein